MENQEKKYSLNAPGEIRTHNHWIRSPLLCPLSYGGQRMVDIIPYIKNQSFTHMFSYVIIFFRENLLKKLIRNILMANLDLKFMTAENPKIPELSPGDSVSVHVRIKEGDRERIQEFKGTVIRLRKGGNNANFTVRRIASNGIGVERTFLLHSPRIDKVVVERHNHVRRAQLYFLRDLTGKKANLKQRFN